MPGGVRSRVQFGKRLTEGLDSWTLLGNPDQLRLADVYRLFVFASDRRGAAVAGGRRKRWSRGCNRRCRTIFARASAMPFARLSELFFDCKAVQRVQYRIRLLRHQRVAGRGHDDCAGVRAITCVSAGSGLRRRHHVALAQQEQGGAADFAAAVRHAHSCCTLKNRYGTAAPVCAVQCAASAGANRPSP